MDYDIRGMSCAACSARVEKAVAKLPGVSSCAVSLLTNSMHVEGDATPQQIISAVEAAGYGASLQGADTVSSASQEDAALQDHETPALRKRLLASIGFLLVLMYCSMGHTMLKLPLPAFLADNPVSLALVQMLLAAIVMVINQHFFISGFRALVKQAPNMDSLVSLGSMASFLWSLYCLFAMSAAVQRGQSALPYLHELYFESAAMILTLICVGKMLEARAKGKTTDALKSLLRLSPEQAVVLRDGKELSVPVAQVKKGDIFLLRPGDKIPVDGIVLSGSSAVNEAALTGESVPQDKSAGDTVSAATVNQSGFLQCEATRVGEDTTLSQIIKMVRDAAATKAPIAKLADKISGIFVPVVLAIALVTTLVWLFVGQTTAFALERGISVLVISCPCALGLATPVAIMVGNGVGAKNGLLFKTAVSLEQTGRVKIVALDKTGTITSGQMQVTDILPADGVRAEHLLFCANALETPSEHPLAKAIVQEAQQKGIACEEVTDFQALPGNGLSALYQGKRLSGGSLRYISGQTPIPKQLQQKAALLAEQGKTPLLFTYDSRLLGLIAVADTIKEDSPAAVAELQQMGCRVVMLTGDNQRTANAIGKQAGVSEVISDVLPDGKEAVVRKLMQTGSVAMVGDGINDAPALTRATVGIAIGAGTDVAIDAADVVLMKSKLSDVPAAVRLSRATLRNIRQNLFWAFFYNFIGIPLAAGVWIPLFGWKLSPMFGAAAMSLSSFCVVSNALRLNLVKLHAPKDKALPTKGAPARSTAQVELKISGMMCPHCEQRVKAALEAVPGVSSASVSHQSGSASVQLAAGTDAVLLKKAVEDAGYTVTELTQ